MSSSTTFTISETQIANIRKSEQKLSALYDKMKPLLDEFKQECETYNTHVKSLGNNLIEQLEAMPEQFRFSDHGENTFRWIESIWGMEIQGFDNEFIRDISQLKTFGEALEDLVGFVPAPNVPEVTMRPRARQHYDVYDISENSTALSFEQPKE